MYAHEGALFCRAKESQPQRLPRHIHAFAGVKPTFTFQPFQDLSQPSGAFLD